MRKQASEQLLCIGMLGAASDEGLIRIGSRIAKFAEEHPEHLLKPVTNTDAAALLGTTPACLSTARARGVAPPRYMRIGKLGLYHVSRHELVRWIAGELHAGASRARRLCKRSDLRALVEGYPFLGLTQEQMIIWAAKQHPSYFREPVSGPDAAWLLSKSPEALRSAVWRDAVLKTLKDQTPGDHWWPNRKTILAWVANHYQREKETA